MKVDEGVEKKDAGDWNINWYSRYRKWYGSSPKKLKIELPYDLAIYLLAIYQKEKKKINTWERYLHSHVHFKIIRNSQNVETTYMSVDH